MATALFWTTLMDGNVSNQLGWRRTMSHEAGEAGFCAADALLRPNCVGHSQPRVPILTQPPSGPETSVHNNH